MATYQIIDVVANPLLKGVVSLMDLSKGSAKYWVFIYPLGLAAAPLVYGAYKSQRVALKIERARIKALQIAYVVFFSQGNGQWYWIKDGQLPPP